MKISNRMKVCLLTILISGVILPSCFTSFAQNNHSDLASHDQKVKERLKEKLTEYNIPETKKKVLMDKFKKGEPWDNGKPEYENLKPQIIEENYSKTIYPDGSIKVEGVIKDLSDFKEIYASGLSMREKEALELNERLRQGEVNVENRRQLIQKFYYGEW